MKNIRIHAALFRLALAATVLSSTAIPVSSTAATNDIPLGHKDFYPSDSRPVGWRGDGNGAYPGATPVTDWTEGTLKTVRLKHWTNEGMRDADFKDIGERKPRNIAWRLTMPGFGNSYPIIVGDRVITTADPWFLVCADINSGKIVWVRDNSPFDLMGKSEEEIEELDAYIGSCVAARAPVPCMIGNYCRLGPVSEPDREDWVRMFSMALPPLRSLVANNRYGEHAIGAINQVEKGLDTLDTLQDGQEGKPVAGIFAGIQWQGALPDTFTDWFRKEFRFFTYVHWDGWTGWTWPAPLSDGACVYAYMGQGQVVCYDLAGNRVWGVHIPHDSAKCDRGDGLRHLSSPQLSGDVLCVQSTTELVGLDKRTGKELWRHANTTFHYVIGAHKAARLDTGELVLVTTSGKIIRTRDGKLLGETGVQGWSTGGDGGESIFGENNRIIQLVKPGKWVELELLADGADGVKVRQVWEQSSSGTCGVTPPSLGGFVYRWEGPFGVLDRTAGKGLSEKSPFTVGVNNGNIIAGKYMFTYEHTTEYGRARPDGRMVIECQSAELLGGGRTALKGKGSLLDLSDPPHVPYIEKYNPVAWKARTYGALGSIPPHSGNGGWCAQGNRLILRTTSSLFCFGDPATRYDWNPATRPEKVTAAIGAAIVPDGARGVIPLLKSKYRPDHDGAVQRLTELPETDRQSLVPEIAKLVADERWFVAKAACLALQTVGVPAADTAPALMDALKSAIDRNHRLRSVVLAETVSRVAPAKAHSVCDLIAPTLASKEYDTIATGCRTAAALGPGAEPLVANLTPLLTSTDRKCAAEAARALRCIGKSSAPAAEALGSLLSGDPITADAAIGALEEIGAAGTTAVPSLGKALFHTNTAIAVRSADLLRLHGASAKSEIPQLMKAVRQPRGRLVVAAAEAITAIDPKSESAVVDALCEGLGRGGATAYYAGRALRKMAPRLTDPKSRKLAVDSLVAMATKRESGPLRIGVLALQAFGDSAKSAVPLLREIANEPDCPNYAKATIKIIDPKADTANVEVKSSIDTGLDL